MATKTRAAVLVEHGKPLAVEEIVLQDPQGPEVLVEYFASGICHSQLHHIHSPAARTPSLLGHEGTGVVVKVGNEVTHIKEGDHCMVTWVPRDINMDSPALPPTSYEFRGEERTAGVNTWSEQALIKQQLVVPLTKDVETAATAIVGCATVTGVGAVMGSAKVQPGQSVAVIGVGGVGINVIAGAKIAGANPIIAVDLADDKLTFAKAFGATHTVNASETDAVEAIRELTGGGADYAFDAIGGPITTPQILAAVRSGRTGAGRGGTAVVVGIPMEPVVLPPEAFPGAEKHLIGSIGGSSHPAVDYPQYIDWFQKGELPLDKMITTIYNGLDKINEGVRALEAGEIRGRSIMVYK
ncbi:MAG TPA: alcohol dehydrogenase [Gammaproteobacteria bacterium]|nr:alcohol dehydrogenase [Gammaproteobacteria bacterium]